MDEFIYKLDERDKILQKKKLLELKAHPPPGIKIT